MRMGWLWRIGDYDRWDEATRSVEWQDGGWHDEFSIQLSTLRGGSLFMLCFEPEVIVWLGLFLIYWWFDLSILNGQGCSTSGWDSRL